MVVAGFTAFCVAIAVVVSLYLMTPVYKVQATIEPTANSKEPIVNYLNSSMFHKNMISKYDLLKQLYPSLWNEKENNWIVGDDAEIPTIETALADEVFPLAVKTKGNLITLEWEGADPDFCTEMLKQVTEELRSYMNNEYVTVAQMQMEIYGQDLDPYTKRFENAWNQFWKFDRLTVATMEVLNQFIKMKDRISVLKVEDVLSRQFTVLSEPITPRKSVSPNHKSMLALSFVCGLFLSIFLLFFYQFLKNAGEKRLNGK